MVYTKHMMSGKGKSIDTEDTLVVARGLWRRKWSNTKGTFYGDGTKWYQSQECCVMNPETHKHSKA